MENKKEKDRKTRTILKVEEGLPRPGKAEMGRGKEGGAADSRRREVDMVTAGHLHYVNVT